MSMCLHVTILASLQASATMEADYCASADYSCFVFEINHCNN